MKPFELSPTTLSQGRPRNPSRLKLLVAVGPDQGSALELGPGVFTVGSAEGCDLVLRDPGVGERHLEITVSDLGVELRDLGSGLGSLTAGARFERIVVGAGAVVAIGGSELWLQPMDADARSATLEVEIERDLPFKAAKDRLVQRWEREYVARLMTDTNGNVTHAARRAGMNRVHLYRLLKKHGFDRAA